MNPINPIKHNEANTHRRPDALACYYALLSAPKSISITASLADAPRIIEAHNQAVSQIFNILEGLKIQRVRGNSSNAKAQHKPDGGNS